MKFIWGWGKGRDGQIGVLQASSIKKTYQDSSALKSRSNGLGKNHLRGLGQVGCDAKRHRNEKQTQAHIHMQQLNTKRGLGKLADAASGRNVLKQLPSAP